MKVNRGASQSLQQAQAQNDAKASKTNKGKQGKAANALTGASAQVSLSPKAQQIQKATEIAKKTDSVDQKKVAYFQNLIDSGKYNMDSASIADKLIDDHMKMPT